MARRRVKLQWIINEAKRKVTFKRRLAGIIKKVSEITVLCDISACLLVYRTVEAQPVVWPSVEEATGVLQRYKDLPESGKFKKTLDGEGLLRQEVGKTKVKLYNIHRDNCKREIDLIIHDFFVGRRQSFDDLAADVFGALAWKVAKRLQAINVRIETLRAVATPALPAPPPQPQDALAIELAPPPAQVVVPAVVPPAPAEVPMVSPLAMVPMPPPPVMVPTAAAPPAQAVPVLLPPAPEGVPMVAPLAVAAPMVAPYAGAAAAPMTLDGQPRHGSYLFEVLDACDVAGDGSGIPTTKELHHVFVEDGILARPQSSNPSSNPV